MDSASESVRKIDRADQFLVAGNGEAVGHPGEIVADAARQRFLALAALPAGWKRCGIGAVMSCQIGNDPLRLEPDRAKRAAIVEMLVLVARPERVPERRPPEWLSRVEDLLKNGFQENLTIGEVAAQVSVNPAYLSRVFRQFHHQAIGDYLHDLRVQFACQQLADPDVALSALASASGFADQSHFTRVFKQCTGMTPGAFRAMTLSNKTPCQC